MAIAKDWNLTGSHELFSGFHPEWYVGQSFTAGSSYELDSISFKALRGGSPGTVTVSLYATDGSGLPTGSALSTGSTDGDTLSAVAAEVRNVSMSSYNIVGGTKYAIVFDQSVDAGTNYVKYIADDTPDYAGGNYIYDLDGPGEVVGWVNNTLHDLYFIVYATDAAPSKPTTPTPADASGPGIDFSNWTLSWVDGGGADTFSVYASLSSGALNQVVSGIEAATYQIPVGSPYRSALLGGVIYWRVDATNDNGTTTGDEWSFDPRPAKPTNPTPADAATDQRLNVTTLSWDAADVADTYDVYFTGYLAPVSVGQAGVTCNVPGIPLDYGETYTWRVDSENEFGTTTGDEWTFTTLSFGPPFPVVRDRTTGEIVAAADYDSDTDYLTGENFVTIVRRLVAAAKDTFYYEEV